MPNWVTNKIRIEASGQQLKDILSAVQRDGDVYGSFDFNKLIPMPKTLDITHGSITDEAINAFLSHLRDEVVAHPDRPGTVQDLKRYADATIQIKSSEYFPTQLEYLTPAQIDQLAQRHGMSTLDLLELGKRYLDNQLEYGAHTWYQWAITNWSTKWNVSEGNCLEDENTLVFDTAWSAPVQVIKALSEKFPTVELHHAWADEDIGQNVGECTYLGGDPISVDLPPPGSARAYEMAFDIMGQSPEDLCLRFDPETDSYVYDEELEAQRYGLPDTPSAPALQPKNQTTPALAPSQSEEPLPDNIWITVYKDILGHPDDHDNLTEVLVPTKWLTDQLSADNLDIHTWLNEYTADHTDALVQKALAENLILDCKDPLIKSSILPVSKPSLTSQIESASTRTSDKQGPSSPAKEKAAFQNEL